MHGLTLAGASPTMQAAAFEGASLALDVHLTGCLLAPRDADRAAVPIGLRGLGRWAGDRTGAVRFDLRAAGFIREGGGASAALVLLGHGRFDSDGPAHLHAGHGGAHCHRLLPPLVVRRRPAPPGRGAAVPAVMRGSREGDVQASKCATVGGRPECKASTSSSMAPPSTSRGSHPPPPSCASCVIARASPAPRKAAPKATVAPARWRSWSTTRRAVPVGARRTRACCCSPWCRASRS